MFALRPVAEKNESLESYIVRLSELNHFRINKIFPHFKMLLAEENERLAGSVPNNLKQFNLFHANTSSSKRYRALHVLAKICCKEPLPILELAVYRSDSKAVSQQSYLYWQGHVIPRSFFRTKHVPVCPACLKEQEHSYIPQQWHFEVVRACPKHESLLVFDCPNCKKPLNYLNEGIIKKCSCGLELASMPLIHAPAGLLLIAKQAFLSSDSRQAIIFDEILWFVTWVKSNKSDQIPWSDGLIEECAGFFSNWPENIEVHLSQRAMQGLEYATRPSAETAFSSVFGNLLLFCRTLNIQQQENRIRSATFEFFEQLVFGQSEYCGLSKLLLNSFEASLVLETSIEQVARLQEDGILTGARKHSALSPINCFAPFFSLEDVYTVWASRFQSSISNRKLYLSRW